MHTNTETQWTKTTTQSGQMVITLHPAMVESLDLDDLATYLTEQGWTRRPTQRPASTSDAAKRRREDTPAGFDRALTCACSAHELVDESEVRAGAWGDALIHAAIACLRDEDRA